MCSLNIVFWKKKWNLIFSYIIQTLCQKSSLQSNEVDERSGHSKEAVIDENIKNIDRNIILIEIADILNISNDNCFIVESWKSMILVTVSR